VRLVFQNINIKIPSNITEFFDYLIMTKCHRKHT